MNCSYKFKKATSWFFLICLNVTGLCHHWLISLWQHLEETVQWFQTAAVKRSVNLGLAMFSINVFASMCNHKLWCAHGEGVDCGPFVEERSAWYTAPYCRRKSLDLFFTAGSSSSSLLWGKCSCLSATMSSHQKHRQPSGVKTKHYPAKFLS